MLALLPRIEKTLKSSKTPTPETLKLLKLETDTSKHNTIALAMHCFWTGEMRLGSIAGVVTTEAGWYDNREVTLITYHQDIIDLKTLIKKASEASCANSIYLINDHETKAAKALTRVKVTKLDLKKYTKADDSDQKRQIMDTKFSKLKLTPSQATKVNAYARTAPNTAKKFLTKKQAKRLELKE